MTRKSRRWASSRERLEVVQRAVLRIHASVVGDIVTVIAQWRGEERQQPDCGDAQVLDVVQPLCEPAQVADSIVVAVSKGTHMELVDNGVLEPGRASGFTHGVRRYLWASCQFRESHVVLEPPDTLWSTEI